VGLGAVVVGRGLRVDGGRHGAGLLPVTTGLYRPRYRGLPRAPRRSRSRDSPQGGVRVCGLRGPRRSRAPAGLPPSPCGSVGLRLPFAREAAFYYADRADPQPRRRGQRRGRSRRSSSVARRRRRFSSRASSRSSLSPTSRNIRSTAAPSPRVISAMASTSPVNPRTRAAQIRPATTSAAADPNARTRGRGATAPRYRFG
jgi:hypothetical protein